MYTNDFDREFYSSGLTVREYDIILSFEDEYHIEKAIGELLDNLGFRITDKGYKYLVYIIHEKVRSNSSSTEMTYWYKMCAEEFSVSRKSVENGIVNTIKSAGKSGKLRKMNEFFNGEYVICEGISNSLFINTIAYKFSVEYKYRKTICFKA